MSVPTPVNHSSLDVFDGVPILEPILWSNTQQTFPTNSLKEAIIDFHLETDRNVMLDLQETYLLLKVEVKKDGVALENADEVMFSNNALHSLFSNCEVYFNNEQIYTSNGLYPHKAQISNEFSGTRGLKDSIGICQGYQYENIPNDFNSAPFTGKVMTVNTGEKMFYGKLAIDVFTCDKFLLPNIKVRIRLIRSRPNFYLISTQTKNFHATIKEASLFTRVVAVDEPCIRTIQAKIKERPARYNFTEVLSKTFIIPNNQNQFIHENIFNNAPIRRIAIAMNTNTAFTGTLGTNPFHYRKFDLREVRIVRGNQVIVRMDTRNIVQTYVTTMKALKFEDDGPNIPLSEYENHFVQVFDLTSTQEANVQMYYPDVVAASLRLELFFQTTLTETIEVIVLGERLSTIYLDKSGTVVKNG